MLEILITGGAGFIGSNLAHRLAADGHAITVADRFRTGDKWRNLAGVSLAGLLAPEALPIALDARHYDVVVHLGAVSSTTETDVDHIVATNLFLSEALLDACAARGTRFLYASSAATYGAGEAGFADDECLAALAALRPLNAYGWSKALFDQWVARRALSGRALPPQWAGLKFFNVYGPHEGHKGTMSSVVHTLHGQIRSGRGATLFGSHRPGVADGEQTRDFVHVDDCVAVIAWLIDRPAVSGLFNVGTGRARTFLDLAHAVYAALGREPAISFAPMPQALRTRYQDHTRADVRKLRAAGYVRPFLGLEEGVADYVQTYLEAPHPYRV